MFEEISNNRTKYIFGLYQKYNKKIHFSSKL